MILADAKQCAVWWAGAGCADPALAALLPAAERERAGRLRRVVDRDRTIAAWALVRALLGELLGEDPSCVAIERHCVRCGSPDHGKPRLADTSAGIHFSLAHSGPHVVVALSRAGAVGIDVECLKPTTDYRSLYRRTLTADEAVAFHAGGARPRDLPANLGAQGGGDKGGRHRHRDALSQLCGGRPRGARRAADVAGRPIARRSHDVARPPRRPGSPGGRRRPRARRPRQRARRRAGAQPLTPPVLAREGSGPHQLRVWRDPDSNRRDDVPGVGTDGIEAMARPGLANVVAGEAVRPVDNALTRPSIRASPGTIGTSLKRPVRVSARRAGASSAIRLRALSGTCEMGRPGQDAALPRRATLGARPASPW